jgi:soluble lytic murein transglycosylase
MKATPTFRTQLLSHLTLGTLSLVVLVAHLCVQNGLFFASQTASATAIEAPIVGHVTDTVTAHSSAPQAPTSYRTLHARELLGAYFPMSPVARTEASADVSQYVHKVVLQQLPRSWKSRAPKVAREILDSSRRHRLDPLFVVALIQTESGFSPDIRGRHGELGLMQIREETGREIARKQKLPFNGRSSLRDPVQNIRLGTAYVASLRNTFQDRALLYIAAYNMGAGNVRSAVSRQVWPKDYSGRIMQKYFRLYAKLPRTLASVTR